jgi:hypothetical protein
LKANNAVLVVAAVAGGRIPGPAAGDSGSYNGGSYDGGR